MESLLKEAAGRLGIASSGIGSLLAAEEQDGSDYRTACCCTANIDIDETGSDRLTQLDFPTALLFFLETAQRTGGTSRVGTIGQS
jgi:hypothetical protein